MAESEKITVNLSVVDIGQIDLLVEQGFYSSRSDFIRTSIRNLLSKHEDVVKQTAVRKQMALGVMILTREGLEKRQEAGEQLDIRVIGMVSISSDVTPELALATIRSINVYGVLKTSPSLKMALADRIL